MNHLPIPAEEQKDNLPPPEKEKTSFASPIASLVFLAIGVLLITRPDEVTSGLTIAVGALLAVYGAVNIVTYLRSHSVLSLLVGVVSTAFGMFTLLRPNMIAEILSILLGLIIAVGGAAGLQRSFALRRVRDDQWWITLLISCLTLFLGVLIAAKPDLFGSFLLVVTGGVLVFEAAVDLVSFVKLLVFTRKARRREKTMAQEAVEKAPKGKTPPPAPDPCIPPAPGEAPPIGPEDEIDGL